MPQNRIPVLQRVSQNLREGTVTDVYALVEDLKCDFPEISEPELERIVSEEVILAHGNAVWEKRRG